MNPQVLFLLNKSLESLRISNLESAELYLKQALKLQSRNPHVLRLLGVISAQRKQYSEAVKYFNDAINTLPKNSIALSNLGNVYLSLKEYSKALDAYDKSIKIDQKYEEVWSNKGNALHELKRFDEAIACHDQAISLKPDYAEAWSNKGNVLNELKRYDEAIAHYETALTLKSEIDWVLGELISAKIKICSWSGLADTLDNFSKNASSHKKISEPLLMSALIDDPLLHKKSAEVFIQLKYPFNATLVPILGHSESQKIRVGYFSADFRNHAVSNLTAELYELHDKNKFEIIAFSYGVDDKSPMRFRLGQAFNQFIDVKSMSDLEIAKLARSLEIDIAIDLTGHTSHSRTGIFSYLAAPIQVNYLGYPGTMGADYIDYIIADKTLIPPESQSFYSEKVVYLPNSYQVNDRKRFISDRQFTRQELGLPEKSFVFCCFNNNFKILPAIFDAWMRILKSAEGSVLWLLEDNALAADNIKREAVRRGVDAQRLVFADRMLPSDHLARHRQADLFIDTLPYNAHTTASDALWTELPVLTLMGESFASRVAASLLNAIGLPELITTTQEEYEATAIELANNPQKLLAIKQKLANNRLSTPLFDTPLFTKNIETAYIKMHERYLAGLEPDHILIQ